MRVPARRSTPTRDYDSETHEPYGYGELRPGERAGPPLPAGRRKPVLRGLIILIVLAGGWAFLDREWALPRWLMAEIAGLASDLEARMSARVESPASIAVARAPPVGARASAVEPPLPVGPSASNVVPPMDDPPTKSVAALPAVIAPKAADAEELRAVPLPPPASDPADPYARRAEAAGLHPDLSRVLLARLSPIDYENARIATERALAETPDDGVFVWPRQRKPELALFNVRFVQGAVSGCRRYVVTITKDGWLTTALPMERCGVPPRQAQRE